MFTKIKLVAGLGIIIVVIILTVAVWLEHREIIKLNQQNTVLTNELKNINDIIAEEVERTKRVEAATLRLEENDNARQQQIQRFASKLNTLAKDNTELRDVLYTVINDELVAGLRAFSNRN